MKELELPLEHESNSKTEKLVERSKWISGRNSCLGINRWISGVTTQTISQPKCLGAKGVNYERISEMTKDMIMKRWRDESGFWDHNCINV